MSLSREVPLRQNQCALLVIDMQNQFTVPGQGINKDYYPNDMTTGQRYLFDRISNTVVPAIQKLLAAFRRTKSEVIYTYVESLTKDGRDQSLDYKISGIFVPKGGSGAQILGPISPAEDEILIPKTSCSVFCSTNIEYVLRNLGVTQIVMVGILTNKCVESAVRDAADKGFLVTVVEEACVAETQEFHDAGLRNMTGFARMCTPAQVEAELMAFQH